MANLVLGADRVVTSPIGSCLAYGGGPDIESLLARETRSERAGRRPHTDGSAVQGAYGGQGSR